MKLATLMFLFLLSTSHLFAQQIGEPVEIKKGLGTMFQQNGRNLTPRQLLTLTENNTEAFQAMKMAKSNYDVGIVFGFAGGFMVGWPLGAALAGGDANWAMAGIGAGLIAVSIPFSSAYNKHAKNAVSIYNEGLKQAMDSRVDFRFGATSSGIGFRMTF